MTATAAHTYAYARTQTATFVADKLRGLLTQLIRDYGFDPKALADAWSDPIGEAARTWMTSGHLTKVTIEFYRPNSDTASARWDFPVSYDGAGVDDLWVDKDFFKDTIAKSPRPPSDCIYRVLLWHKDGAPAVKGMVGTATKSTASLQARDAGTVISTPDIYASARYFK